MTLSKNNWFAIYYSWIYGEYPNDVCSFFWGTLLLVLLAPFVIVGKLIAIVSNDSDIENSRVTMIIIGAFIWLILAVITALGNVVLSLLGYEFVGGWATIFGGFGLGVLFLLNIFIILYLIFLLVRATGNISKPIVVDNTVDFIAAVRGKYCTKITWK